MPDRFTPTERKILAVLADGMRHPRRELHDCLYDETGPLSNIRAHITQLRKTLRPRGEDIVCELFSGGIYYRHVRILAPANDGKR